MKPKISSDEIKKIQEIALQMKKNEEQERESFIKALAKEIVEQMIQSGMKWEELPERKYIG